MINRNFYSRITRVRCAAIHRKPSGIHPLSEKNIAIESHPKFGYKTKKQSLEEIEYIKRKSALEKSLERWELMDWNLDAEVTSFLHRIDICDGKEQFDRIFILLKNELKKEKILKSQEIILEDINDEIEALEQPISNHVIENETTNVEESTISDNKADETDSNKAGIDLRFTLSQAVESVLDAPQVVHNDIVDNLISNSYISKIARHVGFVDLIEETAPSDELIAERFRSVLELLMNDSDVNESVFSLILDLFTAEIQCSHNLVTKWKNGWDNPIHSLEDIINQKVASRLVKSIGENSPMPSYMVALFDSDKQFISKSIGESPEIAAEDAARVALEKFIKLKKDF